MLMSAGAAVGSQLPARPGAPAPVAGPGPFARLGVTAVFARPDVTTVFAGVRMTAVFAGPDVTTVFAGVRMAAVFAGPGVAAVFVGLGVAPAVAGPSASPAGASVCPLAPAPAPVPAVRCQVRWFWGQISSVTLRVTSTGEAYRRWARARGTSTSRTHRPSPVRWRIRRGS